MAVCVILGSMVLPAPLAEAHRDGCHRWHSCPSDSGSYVCGDLGYFSECPGGNPETSTRSKPGVDDDPPRRPRVQRAAAAAGGRVSLTVRAERGSRVSVVNEAGRRVAKATGTGGTQRLRFRDGTGRHTYTLTATDKAGNESLEATKKVSVDATAPKVRGLTATAGTETTGASNVRFTAEPGARWTLAGPGLKTVRGTAQASKTVVNLWLPNGTYRAKLTVRDRAENKTTRKVAFRVRVTRPLVGIERIATTDAAHLTYLVTGMPRSTGRLVLSHLNDAAFTIGEQGTASVAIPITDGTYGPGRVTLTDFAGRQASQPLPQIEVDTQPPALNVTADEQQANQGTLALTIATEHDATVHATAPLKPASLDETSVSDGNPATITRRPNAGTYTVAVTATDAAGNTATKRIDVTIVVPATPAQTFGSLIGLLLILAIPAAAGIIAFRNRRKIRAWREHRAQLARDRAAAAAHAAALAQHRQQMAAHEQRYAAYEAAGAAWYAQLQRLTALTHQAQTFTPTQDIALPIKLKKGEACYGTFHATMVEERHRQGTTSLVEVDAGQVIITNRRANFTGGKNREWAFNKLENVHEASNFTLLTVTNRKTASGVRVPRSAVDDFNLRLRLAIADDRNERPATVAEYQHRLHRHQTRRPSPPQPPPPPPPMASNSLDRP